MSISHSSNPSPVVQWQLLHEAAREAQSKAYAPYSRFLVGAAAQREDGKIFVGANSENASYPVGLCAECAIISALTLAGGGKLIGFLCYGSPAGSPPALTVPCGRCRQLLREHAHEEMLVQTPSGIKAFTAILPESFGPQWLES